MGITLYGGLGVLYGFWDPTYWMIIVGGALSLLASAKVKSTYRKYSTSRNRAGITGAQAAQRILEKNGIMNVSIQQISGNLTDHYDPKNKVLSLSTDVYQSTSVAAVGVAAHECGHAIQYHENYMPIRVRNAIIPLCNVGNYLGWIAIMIGLALGSTKLAFLGFFLMCGILAFQIITLPVEINASKRGLAILQSQYLNENEYAGAWQMLYAAALTYAAGVCATLASMLRILFMILSSSNRDSN